MIIKPYFVQLELTEDCPGRCIHCYNSYSQNRGSSSAGIEVVNAIAECDFFNITITGGEPLTKKQELFSAIKRFKQEQMDVSINTNLYLLEKDDAQRIKGLETDYILTSVLGPNEKIIQEDFNPRDCKIAEGKIKYREERNFKTVYINPDKNATLTKLEFVILQRILAGQNYNQISDELKNIELVKKTFKKLFQRKILIKNNKK
ncbi:MAG: radical SAM protein [Nanoarchaeota archaeon]